MFQCKLCKQKFDSNIYVGLTLRSGNKLCLGCQEIREYKAVLNAVRMHNPRNSYDVAW